MLKRIDSPLGIEEITFKIVNSFGSLVYFYQGKESKEVSFSTSNFPPGIYSYQIKGKNINQLGKLAVY
ncbi:MAG: T9SS type A sorting domain-containing protein [Bacteroidetes bacterium]|nr:T9SS type A sorting domain-containing protein [Bacteroidota bacterium]